MKADPNLSLITHLQSLGYTIAQISEAQETLWNTMGSGDGGYDDVVAVEGLLRQLYESESETDSEDEEEVKGEDSEQTAPTSTNLSITGVTTASGSSNEATMKPNKSASKQRPLSAKLSFVARDVSNLTDSIFALNEWTVKAASRVNIERHLLEMPTKESTDKQEGPLRTIVQRVLLHSNNPKQDQTIVTGCANWITSILLGPACNLFAARGNSSKMAHSTTMKKALGEMLRRGRGCVAQLTLLDECEGRPTPQEFASVVSGSILELLQRAAREKQRHEKPSGPPNSNGSKQFSVAFSSQSRAQMLVKQAESDIAALTAKLTGSTNPSKHKPKNNVSAPTSSVVVDLMSRRDRSKRIADKSGSIVEISVDCKRRFTGEDAESKEEEQASTVNESKSDNGHKTQRTTGQYQTDEEKNAFMMKCLGSALQLSVKTSVAEATSLEGKIEDLVCQSSSEREELTSRQSNIAIKRQEISSRMEQLRRELDELARQDDQLATEKEEVNVELDRLTRKSDKEINGLKSKLEEKASHVTLDKELRRAVDKFSELEMAWIRSRNTAASSSPAEVDSVPLHPAAENGASAKQPEPALPFILPAKLTDYLYRARSYFQSEVACVEFLRNRVSAAEAEVLDLEREIEIFSKLGMKNNVENIKNRVGVLKGHIDEDNIAIDSLRKDAKEMREDLIRRVEEYYAVMKNFEKEKEANDLNAAAKQAVFDTAQVGALEGISIDLTGIGFYDDSDGGLGTLFSKIPKQVSRVPSPTKTNTGSEVDGDGSTSYIGDIDMLPSAKINGATAPTKPLAPNAAPPADKMPKFSWASKAAAPKREAKTLLEIQQEEMAAAKNGNA